VSDLHPADIPDPPPDGSRIVFSAADNGHQDLYTVEPDGTDLLQLTDDAALDMIPSWR